MNATRFPHCSYVIDDDSLTVCGEQDPELWRHAIYVCEYHRWRLETAAREAARKHYDWIERERNEDWIAEQGRKEKARTESARSVYYMACGGYIKIGVAENPMQRLGVIRRRGGVLSPREIDLSEVELLATERGGIDVERKRHAQFADSRSVGEWFARTPDLEQHIASLRGSRALRVATA